MAPVTSLGYVDRRKKYERLIDLKMTRHNVSFAIIPLSESVYGS